MSKDLVKAMLISVGLTLAVSAAVQAKEPDNASTDEKEQVDLEAKLAAARERLEAAAREVGELSAQVYGGPMGRDFIVSRRMQPHAMIGVGIGRPDDEGKGGANKEGVYVESVTPGGPAADAGIKTGDRLVSIDGQDLKNATPSPNAALMRKLRNTKPGEKVKIQYVRDGRTHTAEIVTEAADFGRFGYFGIPGGNRLFGAHGHPAAGSVSPAMPWFSGWAGPGVLDMELVTLTPKLGRYFGADRGVLVVRAPRNSALKLEEGDVILDIDGREPTSGAHAMRILRSYQRDEKVEFNVLRDKKKLQLAVKIPPGENFGRSWGARAFSPAAEADAILPAPEPFEAPVPPPPPVADEVM